jgi:hypothetical protein
VILSQRGRYQTILAWRGRYPAIPARPGLHQVDHYLLTRSRSKGAWRRSPIRCDVSSSTR